MTHWRPALRMAVRDLRRHRVRALLTALLVALPVTAATVAALTAHNSGWTAERELTRYLGVADAQLMVSPFESIRPRPALHHIVKRADADTPRRDPASVEVASLLPAGSRVVEHVPTRSVVLPTGGHAEVVFADAGEPLTAHLAEVTQGRAPREAAEVAITSAAAEEFGLLDGESVAPDARLELASGTAVEVVGLVEPRHPQDFTTMLLAPADSVLRPDQRHPAYFVDLPELTRADLETLHRDLAAAGVVLHPRDAVEHPEAWGLPGQDDRFDPAPLVTGATIILVGTLEVVLVVGAAFAIAARRQVRDLGLLSANGGTAGDVRRALLAQGLVLGALSSVVGVLIGVLAFRRWTPLWEQAAGQEIWRNELDWRSLALVLVLGTLSSFVAALIPAWSIARLTPVAALSGRFPVQTKEAKAHRGAFVLVAGGLVLLAGGGWFTARTFGPGGREEVLAPFVAGLGLLLLVAGVIWATPYLVRRWASLGRALPLTGRYAFRDAGRHRFRSASAVMALTVTVGVAVLAGFAVDAATRPGSEGGLLPPGTMELSLGGGGRDARPEAALAAAEKVVGPVTSLASFVVSSPQRRNWPVGVRGRGEREVRVVSEADLLELVGDDDAAAVQAFRSGAVVTTLPQLADADEVTLRPLGPRRKSTGSWSLPVVGASVSAGVPGEFVERARLVMSEETVAELGLRTAYGSMLVTAERPITKRDLERLQVYGLWPWSSDPDRAMLEQMKYAGVGLAGLLSVLVVGVAVALAAAESRDDVATLAAVGAAPGQRRAFGAVHGLFLALVGGTLGVGIGAAAGLALTQVDGLPGVATPWLTTFGTLGVVLASAAAAGWLVTPTRLDLTRRAG